VRKDPNPTDLVLYNSMNFLASVTAKNVLNLMKNSYILPQTEVSLGSNHLPFDWRSGFCSDVTR